LKEQVAEIFATCLEEVEQLLIQLQFTTSGLVQGIWPRERIAMGGQQ
jgi:hypothetical protein